MHTRLFDLLSRDKLSVAGLTAIHAALRADPDFAAHALWAMRQLDADKAWRAAWLLKRLARDGRLADADVRGIVAVVGEVDHWAARLVLCQLFAATGCPPGCREELFPFLAECTRNRRVILRAWALTVLLPWRGDTVYRLRVQAIVRQARADRKPAMRARLRRLHLARK